MVEVLKTLVDSLFQTARLKNSNSLRLKPEIDSKPQVFTSVTTQLADSWVNSFGNKTNVLDPSSEFTNTPGTSI